MRLAFALVSCLVTACQCGQHISGAQADLQVVPLAVDFGPREVGSATQLSLELSNTGLATLELTHVTLENDARGAFSITSAPSTLTAGASVTLHITYAAPSLEGADGASLVIVSNARSAPELRVSVSGRSVRTSVDAGDDAGPSPDAGFAGLDAGRDAGRDAGVDDAGLPDAGSVADAGSSIRDAGPVPDGGCPWPIWSGSRSVAYQIDVAHSGAQPNDQLTLPLCRRWSHEFGGAVGYPVVADGRVFVVTHTNTGGYGTLLWALDSATGATLWGPVSLGGSYWWAAVAFDQGRVFAVNAGGYLRAFDASSGAVLWGLQVPGQYSCDSAPTAAGGLVYTGAAGSGGTVYGFFAADGGLKWSAPVANGDTSSPALSDAGAFVSYACNQAWGFNSNSGSQLWHHTGTCSGGGGKNVAYYRGRIYTRDSQDLILDEVTGAEVGTYSSNRIPSFWQGLAVLTPGTTLQAMSLSTNMVAWTFDAGGEAIITAPIVVGQHVVAASATQLFIVNVADGTLAGATQLSGVRTPDEQNVSDPLAGFAAADGMLFVPVATRLEAY